MAIISHSYQVSMAELGKHNPYGDLCTSGNLLQVTFIELAGNLGRIMENFRKSLQRAMRRKPHIKKFCRSVVDNDRNFSNQANVSSIDRGLSIVTTF